MEEKLKRLKEFNSKPKRPSQRKECRWCKEEILKDASICPSCQQPQKKTPWLLAHPSVAVSVISIVISTFSLYEAYKAPLPKLTLQAAKYSKDSFTLLASNYGEVPTLIQGAKVSITLRDSEKHATHRSQAVFFFDDPMLLLPNSSRNLEIAYNSHGPRSEWVVDDMSADSQFDSQAFLSTIANGELPDAWPPLTGLPWGHLATYLTREDKGEQRTSQITLIDRLYDKINKNDPFSCQLTLWYSIPGAEEQTAASFYSSYCFPAFRWMSKEFGPFQDKTLPMPWFWDEEDGSPSTQR